MGAELLGIVAALALAAGHNNKTDQATWLSEGAFDVRWGMGVGDVAAIYSNLEPDAKYNVWIELPRRVEAAGQPRRPLRGYFALSRALGYPVRINFRFYRGRLYLLEVRLDGEVPRQQQERWAGEVRALLAEKYGAPALKGPPKDIFERDRRELYQMVDWLPSRNLLVRWWPRTNHISYSDNEVARLADEAMEQRANEIMSAEVRDQGRERARF